MTALVVAAVGLAFADASVVALALPDLYGEFDTSIVGVSWVLTTYALVVAVVAVPGGPAAPQGASAVAGRRRRRRVRRGVARRRVRDVARRCCSSPAPPGRRGDAAAGRLAAGARRHRPGRRRRLEPRRRWWALAGAVGAAIGPALGGILTQLFDWRAIFFVQAPIVAGALVVAIDPAARALRREGHLHGRPGTQRRDVIIANIGFALVFAALVAALFLGVLLAIEVWRYSPIRERRPRQRAPARDAGRAPLPGRAVDRRRPRRGAPCWPSGSTGLAMIPGAQPLMAAAAFAACGAGFDLAPRGARRRRRPRRRAGDPGQRGVDRRPPRRARARPRARSPRCCRRASRPASTGPRSAPPARC